MTFDRLLRWCARSYAQLLLVLRVRDSRERRAMGEDGERMLNAAHARGRVALATTWVALLWDLVVGARHDLAQALRALVRSPAVTVSISLLLGLGVAATTTLFAFVDAVLLRPLPYDQPDRLVMMFESNVSQDRLREGPSPGNILDWVGRNDAFDAITAMMTVKATLRGRDGGTPITGVHVTRGFFDVHRRQPRLGRTFHADEFEGAASITSRQPSSGEPVVVLSHQLWRTLGADPQVVGRTVYIEGRDWRVIGVMPEDFVVPDAAAAFWAPWDMRTSYRGARFPHGPPRDARFLRVVGRIKAGTSIQGAAARMQTLASALESEHPDTNAGWSIRLVPLADEIARTSRLELLLVFAAMFCLLLLLCANVASLAIARGIARAREMAIRLALGARGSRITRQLIAESVLSALVTMVIAFVLTAWWVDAALSVAPADIPRVHEVAMNARVASCAALLALLVTAVGNAVPTFRASRMPIAGALKDGAAVSARASGRLRAGLVVAEIAAAVMLLVGAGLLARTFAELRRVDVGFDTSNLLVLRITPDAARYRTPPQTTDYYRRVLTSLREVPAIASVAAVTSLPMSAIGSEFTRPYWPEGARPEGNAVPEASIRMATPGYFATLRLPVLAGREFTDRDDADAPRVVIINQKLATNAFGSENPVGRNLVLDYQQGPYPYEVVGVVRDDRHKGPRSEPVPEIFIPHAQNPYLVLNVIARTTLDPVAVAQTARAYALRVDPDQPVHSVTTMDQLLGDAVQLDRFAMLLITLFAVGGLITAAGGVYALLAYTVVQRRREIALRMALGASPRRVARSIVMESLVLAVAGGTIGMVGAAASSRFARTLLFGVAPQDPVTLVTAVGVLLVVVVAASWLPARRAALIDPGRAMRI
jgi:putative ABC transport system permease protein